MSAVKKQHVLVIGVDGCRYDSLVAADTPVLDALASRGFLAPVRVDERNPTISGPVWSTVASGVYSDRHLIRDNRLEGHRLDRYPDFLSRVRELVPGASTFAAAAWGPLVTPAAGGPVFAPGGYRPAFPADSEDGELDTIALMDEAVTSRVARRLLRDAPTVTFAYLLLVDMVGHHEGVTPRYRAAIEGCDEQIGVMLAAIDSRPGRDEEEWTVIVVTDHGHRDAGHHGGDSDEERTAWICAAGPGITRGDGVDHADIHPHVLSVLGVEVEPSWELEGSAMN
ncbi:alkaline phosphatase family protein [Arthrobacter sp. NPDC090010]|uniref:alkaline phosphatase family protein n=1 Tax=Arthrobacter sp. NPDC090010 TaxID=3363942 RepID=UPI00381058AB